MVDNAVMAGYDKSLCTNIYLLCDMNKIYVEKILSQFFILGDGLTQVPFKFGQN